MKQMFKSAICLILGVIGCLAPSCGDVKDNPQNPEMGNTEIVGKWQKYGTVQTDGSLSGGDPDEFWIFNSDGSFVNEDGGDITTNGTYTVDGDKLTIISREVDGDGQEENFTGTFQIDGSFMDYTFTEIGKNDYTTYRFLKQ